LACGGTIEDILLLAYEKLRMFNEELVIFDAVTGLFLTRVGEPFGVLETSPRSFHPELKPLQSRNLSHKPTFLTRINSNRVIHTNIFIF